MGRSRSIVEKGGRGGGEREEGQERAREGEGEKQKGAGRTCSLALDPAKNTWVVALALDVVSFAHVGAVQPVLSEPLLRIRREKVRQRPVKEGRRQRKRAEQLG